MVRMSSSTLDELGLIPMPHCPSQVVVTCGVPPSSTTPMIQDHNGAARVAESDDRAEPPRTFLAAAKVIPMDHLPMVRLIRSG